MFKRTLAKKVLAVSMIMMAASLNLTACGGDDAEETTVAAETVVEDTTEAVEETEAVVETTAAQQVQVQLDVEETTAASEFTPVQSSEGRWQKGRAGQWNFILNSTNELATEVAVMIDGSLYYFDAEGNMTNEGWAIEESGVRRYVKNGEYVNGWVNNKYYVDPEKGMVTGSYEIEGVAHLFGDDGLAVDGWYTGADGAKMYGERGLLVTDTVKEVENVLYGFDATGNMITGTGTIKGKKHMFDENGVALQGLVDTEEGKFYCDEGEVQTGKVEVDGIVIAFKEDGTLDGERFVNGIYIKEDGTADEQRRITNIGAFANKDGIDDLMNGLPDKLVNEMFVQNGWKLMYNSETVGSLEEIEAAGSVNFSQKFLRFHNLDTVGHRLGHYVAHTSKGAGGISEIRAEEAEGLGWDEYFCGSDNEYFSEAVGKVLLKEFDKEKGPKTYEYVVGILKERYDFEE